MPTTGSPTIFEPVWGHCEPVSCARNPKLRRLENRATRPGREMTSNSAKPTPEKSGPRERARESPANAGFCTHYRKCLAEKDCLAGAGGFEPPYGGIKIRCLTAWRRPSIRLSAVRRTIQPPRRLRNRSRHRHMLKMPPRKSGGTSRQRGHVNVFYIHMAPPSEHVPKKLNDFFDNNMLQHVDIARFLIARTIPSEGRAR